MRPTTRTAVLSALAIAGAAAIAAPAAWAQADDHGPRDGMLGRLEAMRQAHEQQHVQDLKTILRMRPDQEPALTAFLASHRHPDHPPMDGPGEHRGPPGAPPAAMTTTQRLDMEAKREAEMSAMHQKHAEALRTFYAALSPDQRQVFDALQRMEHGGFGHHHGFGGPGFAWGHGPDGPPPPGDE